MRMMATALGIAALLPILAGEAHAQDDPFAGVTIETLGSTTPAMAQELGLAFLRITMEPGARIAPHSHPGTVIVVVDEGVFRTVFTRGTATLTRFGGETETLRVDTEALLQPGDGLAYDGGAAHVMENGSDVPLVLLVSALLDPAEEGFLFHEAHAGE